MFDWNGILTRVGNLALDIKQAQERNRKIGLIVLGAGAVLIVCVLIFKWRR